MIGFSLLALGVLFALFWVPRDKTGLLLAGGGGLMITVLAIAWRAPREPHSAVPRKEPEDPYVGSAACSSCHHEQHASWWRTYHRSMTRLADSASMAPELPVRLELDGRSYEIGKNPEGAFEVVGPDLHAWGTLLAEIGQRYDPESDEARVLSQRAGAEVPRRRREIVLTTGSHHYQAFWVEGGRSRELRQLPFVYLLDTSLPEPERWLPRRDAFLQPPDALPHIARWNANCVQCHSVAGRPGHSTEDDTFDSSVVDFGIGCEACHGPGAAHVAHYQNPIARYVRRGEPHAIINPARLDAERSSAVCGQCHSYFLPQRPDEWWESGFAESYRPGDSLEGSRLVLDFEQHGKEPDLLSRSLESVFWPDGTIRVGGREYNGLVRSPCFERGTAEKRLACVSCHSMHQSDPDDQLAERMEGTHACTQCHQAMAERIEEHSHHPAGSSGSLCYNCHMPRTTYALLKGIRSHRITSPRVEHDEDAAPNACNLCHLDRSLGWTEYWLERWWSVPEGAPSAPEPSGDDLSAATVWLLAGNAAQRVLLADAMAQPPALEASGTDFQPGLLERLLDDPYAAVRFVARRSLDRLAEQKRAEHPSATERGSVSPRVPRDPTELDALTQRRNDVPITISE